MKIAILSDPHGNIDAFRETIYSIKSKQPSKIIFVGDICGYYYFQNQVIDILRKIDNLHIVLGNHDKSFLDLANGKDDGEGYRLEYGKSNDFLVNTISPENLQFLENIKEQKKIDIGGYELGIFHGSPWDALYEYIYPDSPLDRFQRLSYDFVILGHTHYAMDREEDNVRVINPGSCGQPRDSNKPSYAMLDLPSGKVDFFRIEYDSRPLIQEIKKKNETNKYLIDVLLRKKSKHIEGSSDV